MQQPIRDKIVENLVSLFKTPKSPLEQQYRIVSREAVCEGDINQLRPGEAILYIKEGDEVKVTRQFNSTVAQLEIIFEVIYKTTQQQSNKLDPTIAKKLNYILAEIIKVVMEDRQRDNNALNTEEVSNAIDIEGYFDQTVGLDCVFTVTYRHGTTDPTKLMN